MDNLFQNNKGGEHPSREMLLLCVDGELQPKEATQLEAHLEACWPCRVKTKKIQEAIADIIEFDEQVFTPRFVPPHGWSKFDRQLRALAAESGNQSLLSRVFGSLGRFFPVARMSALASSIRRRLLTPVGRTVAAGLILILVVSLLIYFRHEPTVSARELLKNSIEAQELKLIGTTEPVIHQKIHVHRKDQVSAHEESVKWEIWNDTKNSRVRQFVEDRSQAILIADNAAAGKGLVPEASVVSELAQVLQANHMDPLRPLSATSYQAWHNRLQGQRDEVTSSKLADGMDTLKLRTIPAGPVNVGQIAEAMLVVRGKDWQPTQLRFSVQAEGGNHIYELTEDLSEVVTLAQVDPAMFAEQPAAFPSAASPPKQPEIAKVESVSASPRLPVPTSPVPATAELEVEALRLLNQAGADLGEQIDVKRTSGGMLEITGIVETDQRKTEIINALGSIASSPAVRTEIQTVAEAVAKQSPTMPTPSPSVRAVEIAGVTMAAGPELRAHFAGKREDTDEAVRRFAARMVGLSGQAMDHLWAMKRLLNQFSPEQVRGLTPEARAKWLGLIRGHAGSYRQTSESLRREIQPVFFPTQSAAAASPEKVVTTDTNELSRVVEQLFELGSSNDRVIRSAFTTSTAGTTTTVIKSPQFWQALRNAESRAAGIASQ